MKWAIVKQPFPKGGLGIRDLITFNEALLGKWLWRFMNEKDKLWRCMIKAKYGAEGLDWIPSKYNGSCGVRLWKFISRGWDRFFSHIVCGMLNWHPSLYIPLFNIYDFFFLIYKKGCFTSLPNE